MISAGLLSCSVNSINECPRIKLKCPGKILEDNESRVSSNMYFIFLRTGTAPKTYHSQIKFHTGTKNATVFVRREKKVEKLVFLNTRKKKTICYSVLPGCNNLLAFICRRGSSLKINSMVSSYNPLATAAVVLELLEVAGRAVEARRHHRSLVKDQTCFVCFVCYCSSDFLLAVRRFAHLPMTGRTRGYSGLRPHPSLAPHVSVHTALAKVSIDAGGPMQLVLCGGRAGSRLRRSGRSVSVINVIIICVCV